MTDWMHLRVDGTARPPRSIHSAVDTDGTISKITGRKFALSIILATLLFAHV